MIVIDTNVLVALAEPRDQLNARALADLPRIIGPTTLTQAVLTEAISLVTGRAPRARLQAWINLLDPDPCPWNQIANFARKFSPGSSDMLITILTGPTQSLRSWPGDSGSGKFGHTTGNLEPFGEHRPGIGFPWPRNSRHRTGLPFQLNHQISPQRRIIHWRLVEAVLLLIRMARIDTCRSLRFIGREFNVNFGPRRG